MELVTIWFNLCIAVAVLAFSLEVRAATITKNQPELKKRAHRAARKSFIYGAVCILLGIFYCYWGLPAGFWWTGATILIVSVGASLLLVQKSAKKMHTIAYRLAYTAVAIFLVSAIALVILKQLAILQ
jgi:cytochrome bd-type quinol oxidase subunit 2